MISPRFFRSAHAYAQSLQVVKFLISAGADPNLPEPGLTPWGSAFMDAIAKGNEKIIDFMFESGSNPNQAVIVDHLLLIAYKRCFL